MRQIPTLFIGTLCLCSHLHAEITVNARFNPSRIALGNASQYIVEIVETATDKMPVPEAVTSLSLTDTGGISLTDGRTSSSSQTKIVNNSTSFTHIQRILFQAKASTVGTFDLPEHEIAYKGQSLIAPAARLTVVERAADAAPTIDELIFLRTEVPDSLYVGQTVPVRLKLHVSENLALSGLNAFQRRADGFIVSELPDQSAESIETIDGRRYRVLAWTLTATPIRTGQQDISFQFTASVRNGAPTNPFGGSSLFDDFFGSRKRFDLVTQPAFIDVKPIPESGRPADFSGAIGDFNMQVHTDLEETRVGEPIMLSVKVTGTGNFDRIGAPVLPESPDWRGYDPESQFEAADTLGLKGTKRFDYLFIPRNSGTLELPSVRFAFLDPETGEYTTLKSPPLTVKVALESNRPTVPQASSALPEPNLPELADHETPVDLTRSLTPEEALLTLEYRPRPARKIDGNWLRSQGFYFIQICLLSGYVAFGFWIIRRKRLSQDPDYALVRTAGKALKSARRAVASAQDAESFYLHALQAVRLAATRHSRKNLHNAEPPEIVALLEKDEAKEALHALFATAHAHRFSPANKDTDLASARRQLNIVLSAL